jgi:hypothetical protein
MHSIAIKLQRQLEAEAELNYLRHEKILRSLESHAIMPSTQPRARALRARVEEWNTTLGSYFGLKACLIVSETNGKIEYRLAVRCPLMGSKMLRCSIASSWPSWTQPSFSPRLRVQNIIEADSEILVACQKNNVEAVTDLILSGRAHPNDTTAENQTLIYVIIPYPLRGQLLTTVVRDSCWKLRDCQQAVRYGSRS